MTNTPETMALAPCPFCGGEAVDVDTSEICCPIEYNAHARCSDCDAQGPGEYRWDTPNEAKAEAIAAWNRRSDTRPAPVSVRELTWEPWASDGSSLKANTDLAHYVIWEIGGTGHLSTEANKPRRRCGGGLKAAKAAAQADYNARILSALQPAPAVEGLARKLLDEIALECQQTGQVPPPAIAAAYEALEDALLGRAAYEGEKRDG